MHPIHVGTCGWSYEDWKNVFYPKGAKPGDYLTHVAQQSRDLSSIARSKIYCGRR
jgi:uncharacterized protein YecE (DUF72 family)